MWVVGTAPWPFQDEFPWGDFQRGLRNMFLTGSPISGGLRYVAAGFVVTSPSTMSDGEYYQLRFGWYWVWRFPTTTARERSPNVGMLPAGFPHVLTDSYP